MPDWWRTNNRGPDSPDKSSLIKPNSPAFLRVVSLPRGGNTPRLTPSYLPAGFRPILALWKTSPNERALTLAIRSREDKKVSSLQENNPPPAKRTAQITVIKLTEIKYMLYTIVVVLLILWVLGLVTSYTMGGFIHILLAVALVLLLVNLFSGRKRLG